MHLRHIASAVVAAVFVGSASAAIAHDFFLMPDKFVVSRVTPFNVQASVGSSFPQPEAVVAADRLEQLSAYGPGSPQLTVAGTGEKALNLRLSGADPGTAVAAAKVKPRDVEYGEDRIPLILGEYRVSSEAASAVDRLQRPRTWRVISRRYAKALICIVRCGGPAAEGPTGAEFEFVATKGSRDHFWLLKSGKPLANYPVDVVGADGKRLHLSTDGGGSLHVATNATGPHMLFAAFLTPPVTGDQFTLDLTSLTFSRSR
jgi:hypothetical protein